MLKALNVLLVLLLNRASDEIQILVIHSRAILVAVSAFDRGLSVKLGQGRLGHWQTALT